MTYLINALIFIKNLKKENKELKMKKVAQELLKIAKEVSGATKDLAEIRSILPELRQKQDEYYRKKEEQQREINRLWSEANSELENKTNELLKAIQKELKRYFLKNGMGVRSSDLFGGLLEIFIGNKDGIDRRESKVSCHISLTFKGNETYNYMLRNDALDDQHGKLDDKGTIGKLIQVIKKADKSGFWAKGKSKF